MPGSSRRWSTVKLAIFFILSDSPFWVFSWLSYRKRGDFAMGIFRLRGQTPRFFRIHFPAIVAEKLINTVRTIKMEAIAKATPNSPSSLA